MPVLKAMHTIIFYRNSFLFAALLAALMCASFKLDDNQDEHTVKALFIYNFTKHIEWPKDKPMDHFVIGVIGNTPIYDKLSEIVKDRKIKNRIAEIRRYNKTDKIESCNLLFIAKNESINLSSILESNNTYGVLIITEDKSMTNKGYSINIVEKNDRVQFELNEPVLKRAGFKISNQLYELAASIH